MSYRRLACVFVAAFLVASCSKKEEPTEAVPVATAAAVASTAPPVDEDDPAVVTAEDLADKANQEISGENLEKQLDSLEKEIGSE